MLQYEGYQLPQKQLQLVKEEEFAMEDERISSYISLQTLVLKLDRLLPVSHCQLLD